MYTGTRWTPHIPPIQGVSANCYAYKHIYVVPYSLATHIYKLHCIQTEDIIKMNCKL